MLKKSMEMFRVIGISVALLFMASACSSVPKPTSYVASNQKKMQAAYHWDVMAEDVALQIKKRFATDDGAALKSLYVKGSATTPFDEGFRDLLISRMVDEGLTVVREKTEGVLQVDYDVKVIHHKANRHSGNAETIVGKFLRRGVYVIRDVVTLGALTNEKIPHGEVIVTVYVVDNNQYALSYSDVYYINNIDSDHYHKSNLNEKKIQVVGK